MEVASKAQQRAVAAATKAATEAAAISHYPKVQAALQQASAILTFYCDVQT